MTFPTKGFLIAVSVILFAAVAFLAFVIYQEAHVISLQRRLIQDMWQYINLGCPTDQ
jgi:hypothetical protein